MLGLQSVDVPAVLSRAAAVVLWLVLIGLAATASAATHSVALPAFASDGSVERLALDVSSTPQSIVDGSLIHKEEPDRQMTSGELQRILALPRTAWQSGVDPAARASYFTPVTMWMLCIVDNGTEQVLERLLVLQTWRLWDVRFFAVDAESGELFASHEAGQRVPMTERIIQAPEATFPLTLAPRQQALLVIRIQDKTFGPVLGRLHAPEVRAGQVQRAHEFQTMLLGFVVAIVLMLVAAGDWRYTVVALWLGCTATCELVYLVPLLPTLFPSLTPHTIPIFTISGTLGIAAFAAMTLLFFEVYRSRFWLVFYGSCIAFLLACCLIIPWSEEHHLVRRAAGLMCLAVICSWPFAAWAGRSSLKRPYGRTMLLLFAVYWVVALGRFMIAVGVLKIDLHTDPLALFDIFGLVFFALGVVAIAGGGQTVFGGDLRAGSRPWRESVRDTCRAGLGRLGNGR
jgi:hypothetical protein